MAQAKIKGPNINFRTVLIGLCLIYSHYCAYNQGKNIDDDIKTVQKAFDSLSKGMAKLQK